MYRYYNADTPIYQSSSDIFKIYLYDLNKPKGHKRVWILFSAAIIKDRVDEEKYIVFHLDTIGKRLEFFGHSGVAAVYLYDLSETAS